jgi:diamine N-acetyltransferase
VIRGERVRLRAIEREDLPRFHAWLNDEEITEGLSRYLPFSFVEEERWFEQMLARPSEEHPFAIELREDESWQLIGNVGLFNLDATARGAELGIFIGERARWDKGYGTEILGLMLRHSFETLNLNRVYLRVFANNARARRSYEKAGFVLEGTLRQAAFRSGQYIDMLIMSVLRSEWERGREGK